MNPADLDLTDILDRVRTVTRETVAPEAEVMDREARWPEAGIRTLQAAGLGGLVVPEIRTRAFPATDAAAAASRAS